MRNLYLRSVKKENLRCLFAALFLIVLLAEWGSHGVNYPTASSTDAQSISAADGGHDDDPCQTLILCSDSQRKDRQMPGFSHEVMHNGVLDLLSDWRSPIVVHDDPLFPFATAHCLFRPPSPPFHPPEIS